MAKTETPIKTKEAEKTEVATETKDEFLIQFVGRDENGDITEAPTKRVNGMKTIKLPSSDEQKAGFAHDDARFLLKTYPKEFKEKKAKGK